MKVKTQFGEYKISRIEVNKYEVNNAIAIQLYSIEEEYGFEEPFARLTVNLPEYKVKENEGFVDTNNCPWAEKFIEEYKIGKPNNIYAPSGYCSYPEYIFDIERINELNKGENK